MINIQRSALGAVLVAGFLGLAGCSGMTTQDRNTAIGAGVGGAAVGGVIGHEVSKPKQ